MGGVEFLVKWWQWPRGIVPCEMIWFYRSEVRWYWSESLEQPWSDHIQCLEGIISVHNDTEMTVEALDEECAWHLEGNYNYLITLINLCHMTFKALKRTNLSFGVWPSQRVRRVREWAPTGSITGESKKESMTLESTSSRHRVHVPSGQEHTHGETGQECTQRERANESARLRTVNVLGQ